MNRKRGKKTQQKKSLRSRSSYICSAMIFNVHKFQFHIYDTFPPDVWVEAWAQKKYTRRAMPAMQTIVCNSSLHYIISFVEETRCNRRWAKVKLNKQNCLIPFPFHHRRIKGGKKIVTSWKLPHHHIAKLHIHRYQIREKRHTSFSKQFSLVYRISVVTQSLLQCHCNGKHFDGLKTKALCWWEINWEKKAPHRTTDSSADTQQQNHHRRDMWNMLKSVEKNKS